MQRHLFLKEPYALRIHAVEHTQTHVDNEPPPCLRIGCHGRSDRS